MKPSLRQMGLTGQTGLCKRGVIPGFVKSSLHYHKLSTTGSIQRASVVVALCDLILSKI